MAPIVSRFLSDLVWNWLGDWEGLMGESGAPGKGLSDVRHEIDHVLKEQEEYFKGWLLGQVERRQPSAEGSDLDAKPLGAAGPQSGDEAGS